MRQTIMFLAMIAGACGSSNDNPMPADASPTGDGANTHDAPGAPETRRGGVVIETIPSVAVSIAVGEFTTTADSSTTLGTIGPCTAAPIASSARNDVSAGTLTITGTTDAVTIMPTGTPPNVKYMQQLATPPYADGATITASVSGTADFPAFSVSAMAPSSAIAGFASPTSVSRAAGFVAAWTVGAGPHMYLGVVSKAGGTDDAALSCTVPDTGSFTITPAMLALFPSQDDKVSVSLARGDLVTLSSPHVSLTVLTSTAPGFDVPLNP